MTYRIVVRFEGALALPDWTRTSKPEHFVTGTLYAGASVWLLDWWDELATVVPVKKDDWWCVRRKKQ